ncbi:probable aspartic proteinase GIP2 [Malania oleifera]|uniref:probable aspartic proteinase GIP2 n=1 Tax=Malania oleifera TaxID=397392 RepID=UPI0025AE7D1D|nr:probable aspartic proteinase GIP2 [Malania oleifera]
MASLLEILLFISLVLVFIAQNSHSAGSAVVLSVTKHAPSLQYVTRIHHGTPLASTPMVLHLGGPFLWLDCASAGASPSRRPVPCRSLHCSTAEAHQCGTVLNRYGFKLSTTCRLNPENPLTRTARPGELARDAIAVRSVDPSGTDSILAVQYDDFLFSCAPTFLLKGLASGAKGMLGLGRTRIALPSQLSAALGLRRKFAVCLSPSEGVILAGQAPDHRSLWNSLVYTPLIATQSEEYSVTVKSIAVNGKKLSINSTLLSSPKGGIRISTVVPYTLMESSIYEVFVAAFANDAVSAMNLTRVAAVAPFGVCFSSEGVGRTAAGPAVAVIDLLLQSEMVRWRIYGRNSMVEVGGGAMCLGFLDGGSDLGSAVILGGHQLEENLLDFDLENSMLGFSSMLARETSCSKLRHKIMDESL